MPSIGGSKGESSQSTTVDIPQLLQGLLPQAANFAEMGLSNLNQLFGQGVDSFVAPFTQAQQQGQAGALDVAAGGGDFLPTAQQFFMNTAQGLDPSQIIGANAGNFLSDAALGERLGLDQFIDPTALQGLQATAGGAGLGMDEGALRATLDTLMPQVGSAFGGSMGGLSGVAARDTLGQGAINRIALDRQRDLDRQFSAQGLLSGLGENERGRAQRTALDASSLLAGIGGQERGRAFDAASMLPEIGLLGSNIQREVGAEQQQLEQQRLSSPLQNQMQLMSVLRNFLPIEALLGQTSVGDFSNFGMSLDA
jgi:hypothetical protein